MVWRRLRSRKRIKVITPPPREQMHSRTAGVMVLVASAVSAALPSMACSSGSGSAMEHPDRSSSPLVGGDTQVVTGSSQLVWGGTTGSIRSYVPDGGGIDLVPLLGGRTIRKLRLSDDRLVWISATPVPGGSFIDARWHWSPRTADPASIVVHDGPSLPAVIADGGTDMQVGGDWAATVGYDGTARRIYVWHITTGDTWVLPNRPGFYFGKILAVSPTELVFGEAIATQFPEEGLANLVRIDLAALPALVAEWSK